VWLVQTNIVNGAPTMPMHVYIVLTVTVFLVGLAWVVALVFQIVLNVMLMQLFAHNVLLDMGH
jgi:hypothetical protein